MKTIHVFILVLLAFYERSYAELRNMSEGMKAFYKLVNSNLEEADFIEIMGYLDQRFNRKCYSLERNDMSFMKTRDILQIVDNLEKEIGKLTDKITEDRTRMDNLSAKIVEDKTRIDRLWTKNIEDRTRMDNISFEVNRDRIRFLNEISEIKDESDTRYREIENKEYISSKGLCYPESYKKLSTGEHCIVLNTSPNLALRKPANQSSTHYDNFGKADAAVDGNRNSDFGRGSCIHTENDKYAPPWWMVDLEAVRQVGRVIIVNRGDGSCWRLQNLVVTVSLRPDEDGEVCGTFPGPGACGQIIEMVCPKKLHGQYVKLTLNNPDSDNYLHVCEVEVYSE